MSQGDSYMKAPCQHCPFRRDVKPFLHPRRAEELAYAAQNPYNTFPCHKTTVPREDDDDEYGGGEMVVTENSKECAGFLTLRAAELGEEEVPDGFKPAYDDVYSDAYEMTEAYEEAHESS